MMAALVLISVLALAGACFPSTPPHISNLRQRTRHRSEGCGFDQQEHENFHAGG